MPDKIFHQKLSPPKSKPKVGKVTADGRLQSIYLLFIRMRVKNTASRTTIPRRTPVSTTAVVATAATTHSPKAIFSATSLLSALVLLTNYSSGTKPFPEPTVELFFL